MTAAALRFVRTYKEYDAIDAETVQAAGEAMTVKNGTMDIRPIKTEADYDMAIAEVDRLFGAPPGSAECDRFEVLTVLIEAYEREHHPMPWPDPIAAIKFRMEQGGLKQVDLIPANGSKSHVSEVLNRRRPLTLPMIRRLSRDFGIPLEVLVREYEIAA